MKPLRYYLPVALLAIATTATAQSPSPELRENPVWLNPCSRVSAGHMNVSSAPGYRLVEYQYESWDGAELIPQSRENWSYDSAGNLAEILGQWNDPPGEWTNNWLHACSYDEAGRLADIFIRTWGGDNGWMENERYTPYFLFSRWQHDVLSSSEDPGWHPTRATTYVYDSPSHTGRLTEYLVAWFGQTRFDRVVWSYDAAGNVIGEVTSWSGSMSEPWDVTGGKAWSYDDNGRMTEEIPLWWDGTQLIREHPYSSRHTYSYDEDGRLSEKVATNWDGTQWVLDSSKTFSYDAAGNLTEIDGREKSGFSIERETYTWEAISVSTEGAMDLPSDFVLSQNYPNPFNPTTTISYDLRQTADVKLVLYDLLGREVRELVSDSQSAGNYQVSLDAAGLPSGVYFYRLAAGDYVRTRRMVVVK